MSTDNAYFCSKTRNIFIWIYPGSHIIAFSNRKVLIFSLFLHENICCGYSLEVPL